MSYILESLKKSDQERQLSNAAVSITEGVLNEEISVVSNTKKSTLMLSVLLVCFLLFGMFFFNPFRNSKNTKYETIELPVETKLELSSGVNLSSENPLIIESLPVQPLPSDIPFESNLPVGQPSVDNMLSTNNDASSVDIDEEPEAIKVIDDKNKAPLVDRLYRQSVEEKESSVNTLYESRQKNAYEYVANKKFAKTPSIPVVVDRSEIPSVFTLERSRQQSIPSIAYGAHIYASDNKSGFVILNGAKRQAGERMSNGVYVESVNENSVILSFKGVVFSLPAMKDWKP